MIPPPLRFIQGTLLFIPTTFILPNSALIIYAIFSVLFFLPSFKLNDRIYFLFIIGVAINFLLGIIIYKNIPDSLLINNGLIGCLILIMGYLSARSLNDTTWRIILFYITVEIIFIYAQFLFEVRYFFPQQEVINLTTEFQFTKNVENINLLYFIRPMGLSSTSTIAAAKILLGLLLIFMLNLKPNTRKLLIVIFIGAAVINFKRSGLISLGFLFIIIFFLDFKKNGWNIRHTIITTLVLLIFSFYAPSIISQITRESALSLDQISFDIFITQLSGRAALWNESFMFIKNNIFFGNFSERLILSTGQYSHSSYLSLLATHGIFLSLTLLFFIISKIKNKFLILIFLTPIFIDAIFQEDLFWYISIIDQFVLYLLITRKESVYWKDPFYKISR